MRLFSDRKILPKLLKDEHNKIEVFPSWVSITWRIFFRLSFKTLSFTSPNGLHVLSKPNMLHDKTHTYPTFYCVSFETLRSSDTSKPTYFLHVYLLLLVFPIYLFMLNLLLNSRILFVKRFSKPNPRSFHLSYPPILSSQINTPIPYSIYHL